MQKSGNGWAGCAARSYSVDRFAKSEQSLRLRKNPCCRARVLIEIKMSYFLNLKEYTGMADLDVQPKKKSSLLPWLLLGLGLVALIFFLTRDKDGVDEDRTATSTTHTTSSDHAAGAAAGTAAAWDGIDFSAPRAS